MARWSWSCAARATPPTAQRTWCPAARSSPAAPPARRLLKCPSGATAGWCPAFEHHHETAQAAVAQRVPRVLLSWRACVRRRSGAPRSAIRSAARLVVAVLSAQTWQACVRARLAPCRAMPLTCRLAVANHVAPPTMLTKLLLCACTRSTRSTATAYLASLPAGNASLSCAAVSVAVCTPVAALPPTAPAAQYPRSNLRGRCAHLAPLPPSPRARRAP